MPAILDENGSTIGWASLKSDYEALNSTPYETTVGDWEKELSHPGNSFNKNNGNLAPLVEWQTLKT